LLFPPGNGTFGTLPTQQQVQGQVPPPLSTATYTLISSNSTGIAVRAVLPDGTTASVSMKITPDVVYTPTQSDINLAERAGYPVYDFSYSAANTSSDSFVASESYFVPYSALPQNLVSLIDNPGAEAGVFVQLGGAFEGVGVANEIASSLNNLALAEDANEKLEAWQSCVDHPQIPFFSADDQMKMANQVDQFRQDVQEEQIVSAMYTIASHIFESEGPAAIFSATLGAVGDKMLDSVKESTLKEINQYGGFQKGVPINQQVCFPNFRPVWIYDPSGYVYEGLPTNRLPGVTATIFYQNATTGAWVQWNAAAYDQQNQQLTDGQGRYGWNVPQGKWMVVYQKTGYQTIESPVETIPPPVSDLNIGMSSLVPPTVTGAIAVANGSSSYIGVEFDNFVRAGDINSSSFSVTTESGSGITGTVLAFNPQTDPSGVNLTQEAIFYPSAPLSSGSKYVVNIAGSIRSYANVSMGSGYSQTIVAQSPPTYSVSVNVACGCETQVQIGGAVSAQSNTNNPLATQVDFAWYNPQGNLTSSETVVASSGAAQSSAFIPDALGNWTAVAYFTDGNTIFSSSAKTFGVVQAPNVTLPANNLPVVSGSISISSATVNSSGDFTIDSRSTNGIEVFVNGATPDMVATVNSFIYSATPPGTTDISSQWGTQALLYVDVRITNVSGTATVCVTSNSISSQNWMYYEPSGSSGWIGASNVQFGSSDTLCGAIPVSSLHGTPIAITQNQGSTTSSSSSSTSSSSTTSETSTSSTTSSSSSTSTVSSSTSSGTPTSSNTVTSSSTSSSTSSPAPQSSLNVLELVIPVAAVVVIAGVAIIFVRRRAS